jgi:valyl-tRNA synthetase
MLVGRFGVAVSDRQSLISKVSQRSFLDLVAKGKAYIKESPVLWCTECHTAIAQSELDTAEAPSRFKRFHLLGGG